MQYDIFLGTKLVQIVFDITLTRKFWRFSILNRKTIFSLQRKCLISWPPRDRRAAFEHLYHAIDKATTDQTGSESWGLSVIVASNLDSWGGGGKGEVPLSFAGKHRTLSGDAIDLDRLDRPQLERAVLWNGSNITVTEKHTRMKQRNQCEQGFHIQWTRVSMSHFDPFQVKINSTGRGMIGCRQHPAPIMAEFLWFSHLLRQRSAPGRWRYVGTGDPSSTGSRCRWWGALKHRMFHPRIILDRWTFHKKMPL